MKFDIDTHWQECKQNLFCLKKLKAREKSSITMNMHAEGISPHSEDVAISWDLRDHKVFKARTVALFCQCYCEISSAKHF